MNDKVFAELLQSANEALEHAKGKRELRTIELPPPPERIAAFEIKQLRAQMKMSQAVFGHCLNVSAKLVQAWEAKRRAPSGPALLLLRLVQKQPSLILAQWAVSGPGAKKRGRRGRRGKARQVAA